MSEKSVFLGSFKSEKGITIIPSLLFLVHQNTGKKNCYQKIFIAILINTFGRFNQANKKKSVIYTALVIADFHDALKIEKSKQWSMIYSIHVT